MNNSSITRRRREIPAVAVWCLLDRTCEQTAWKQRVMAHDESMTSVMSSNMTSVTSRPSPLFAGSVIAVLVLAGASARAFTSISSFHLTSSHLVSTGLIWRGSAPILVLRGCMHDAVASLGLKPPSVVADALQLTSIGPYKIRRMIPFFTCILHIWPECRIFIPIIVYIPLFVVQVCDMSMCACKLTQHWKTWGKSSFCKAAFMKYSRGIILTWHVLHVVFE